VVSKFRITRKDMAQADEKTRYTPAYDCPPEAGRHFEETCNAVIAC
jgi:hypothetical protein